MRTYPKARVSVHACQPLGRIPNHIIQCSYLGRRQTGGLKPSKGLETLVP